MVGVIVNPHSRKNRRRPDRARRLAVRVGSFGRVVRTEQTTDIAPALSGFVREGMSCWVADGGDGALHWMINEAHRLYGPEIFERVLVSPTNGGTIDFVAHKAGIRGQAEEICTELSDHRATRRPVSSMELDTLRIDGVEVDAQGRERPFSKIGFAAALFGSGQAFFARYYGFEEPGAASILRVVLRACAAVVADRALPGAMSRRLPWPARDMRELFPRIAARVTIDGRILPQDHFASLYCGAIDINLGGVFRLFRLARERDKLHFIVGDATPTQTVRDLPNLVLGRTLSASEVEEVAGRELIVEATGPALFDPVIDGEIYTGLRRLEVRPGPKVRFAVTS